MPDLLHVWVWIWSILSGLALGYFVVNLVMFLTSSALRQFEEFTLNEGLDGLMAKVLLPVVGAFAGGLVGVGISDLVSPTASVSDRNAALALIVISFAMITYVPVHLSNLQRHGTPKHLEAEIHRLTRHPGSSADRETLESELRRQAERAQRHLRTETRLYIALLVALVLFGVSWVVIAHVQTFNHTFVAVRSSIVFALALAAGAFRRLWHRRRMASFEHFGPLIAALPIAPATVEPVPPEPTPALPRRGGLGPALLGSGLLGSGLTAAALLLARRTCRGPDRPGRRC